MIHTAQMIHKGILNLTSSSAADGTLQELQFGNKISILSGDYLLATVLKVLADIKNCKVTDMISKATADFMQSEFLREHDIDGNALLIQDLNFDFWEQKNFFAAGSLMANSCKSTLELAGHDERVQDIGFEFGRNIGLAWQVHFDLQPFIQDIISPKVPFDLVSLPVVFYFEDHSELLENFIVKLNQQASNCDFKALHQSIMKTDAVTKTIEMLLQYSQKAEELLSEFELSPSINALRNIISSLK